MIESYILIIPSNSSPVTLQGGRIYKAYNNGYAVGNITDITPSNSSPVSLTSGDICKMGGAGYAVESVTDITPSDSSPATITSGTVYKATANGKAVESVTDVTPSDASPVSLTSGSIYKAGGNGYAFESNHPQFAVTNPSTSGTSSRVSTYTISNKNGKKLLVLLYDARNTAQTYTEMDSATCSGGTLTKLCNLSSSNIQAAGTFFNLEVSSNTCTITLPTNGYVQVFEA